MPHSDLAKLKKVCGDVYVRSRKRDVWNLERRLGRGTEWAGLGRLLRLRRSWKGSFDRHRNRQGRVLPEGRGWLFGGNQKLVV